MSNIPFAIEIDQKVINVFTKYIDQGLSRISASVIVIMSIFAVFDLYISMSSEMTDLGRALKTLGKKALSYTFWFAVVSNYSQITNAIFSSFANIGRAFSGSSEVDETLSFLSVDKIVGEGFQAIIKITRYAFTFESLNDLKYFFFYLVCLVLAFFFLASAITSLIIAIIQFRLVTGVSLIVLVFITLEFTKDIGMKAINGIIRSALEVSIIYSILNITFFVILKDIPIPDITKENNSLMDMASWTLVYIALTYLASQYKEITNLIMSGYGGVSGQGLGYSIARGISTATTVAIAVVGTVATAGGMAAAAGAGATAGSGASASGSKIAEIFKGGVESYKNSKKTRDTIRNVGNIAGETTKKLTGGNASTSGIARNGKDIFDRFNKKNDNEEEV